MGAAAYNRGSRVIRERISADRRWRVMVVGLHGSVWIGEPMQPRDRDESDWIFRKS